MTRFLQRSFALTDVLAAPIERLAAQWLPFAGEQDDERAGEDTNGPELARQRQLMAQLFLWAVLSPVICCLALLPFYAPLATLTAALVLSGLFMLVAGLLVEQRSVKQSAGLMVVVLTIMASAIVAATGGLGAPGTLLLLIVLFETIFIARQFLQARFAHYICLASAVLSASILSFVPFAERVFGTTFASNAQILDPTWPSAFISDWMGDWIKMANWIAMAMVGAVYLIVRGARRGVDAQNSANEEVAKPNSQFRPSSSLQLDALPGFVTRHDPKGQVLSVHGASPNLLGDKINKHLGSGLLSQIHVADRITYLSAIDHMRQNKTNGAISLRFETSDGFKPVAQFVRLNGYFVGEYDESGALCGFFIQFHECADQVRDQDQQSHGSEQGAHEHHNMHEDIELARTRFLAGVSHELRTPLNSIMGFSDLLLHGIGGELPNERTRDYVNNIRQSSEHLLNVVNTMLDMSKIQNGHYMLQHECFNVTTILDRAKDILQIQADQKNICLTLRAAKNMPDVHADMRALLQILINLVGNAIKFTETGGVVLLDADMQQDRLVLKVSDTGIGIPQDRLAELGQPFMQVNSQLSREYEGTGLGLSLVKGLVGLHGGSFDVKSQLGKGTQVTIILPQDAQQTNVQDDANVLDEKHQRSAQSALKRSPAHVA